MILSFVEAGTPEQFVLFVKKHIRVHVWLAVTELRNSLRLCINTPTLSFLIHCLFAAHLNKTVETLPNTGAERHFSFSSPLPMYVKIQVCDTDHMCEKVFSFLSLFSYNKITYLATVLLITKTGACLQRKITGV